MRLSILFFLAILISVNAGTQSIRLKDVNEKILPATRAYERQPRVFFGIASYYADKFNGRKTATGAIYDHNKYTAACNILALGTWIRVTNLRNNKSIIVQINDRLHPKNKRIVDLSKIAAEKLGYIARGLTQVRVEVISRKKEANP